MSCGAACVEVWECQQQLLKDTVMIPDDVCPAPRPPQGEQQAGSSRFRVELTYGILFCRMQLTSACYNMPVVLCRVSSSQLGGLFPEFVAAVEGAGGCRC
jgi:hypothetical protein